MTPTRRQFIREFGIMLGALIAAGCVPRSTPTASPAPHSTATPMASSSASLAPTYPIPGCGDGSPRERLRACWLGFDWLAEQEWNGSWDDSQENLWKATEQLADDHRAALDELVDDGSMSAGAADQLQAAFAAAALYVRDSTWGQIITCYMPTVTPSAPSTKNAAAERQLGVYTRGSPRRLLQQTDILLGMTEGGGFDENTIARAQSAVERDVALLSLSAKEEQVLIETLVNAGCDIYSFPPVDALALEIPPEDAEAARFLVELLLGEPQ